jgi:uncharacterized protein
VSGAFRDVRRLGELDLADLLALNNDHAVELSLVTPESFRALLAEAWLALAPPDNAALLLVFDQDAAIEGPNFSWFKARYARFIYIDRVVVAAAARGRGLARQLYEKAFAAGAAAGYDMIGCEVNLDPPNPASDAFHAAMGFAEVGQAQLPSGKRVHYLTRPLGGLDGA